MEHLRVEFIEAIKKDFNLYVEENTMYEMDKVVYPKLFDVKNATGAYNSSTAGIGADSLKKKPEGEKIKYSKVGEGFTVNSTWDTYSDGLEFSLENVKDMNESKVQNLVMDKASTWNTAYLQGKDEFAANFFNYGGYTAGNDIFNGTAPGNTDSSGDLCYDGKPFLNLTGNKRPLYPNASETHFNAFALPLTETNLQTAYDKMTLDNAVNSRGQKTIITPDVLLYHPSQKWTVMTLLETAAQVDSANNNINTVKSLLTPVEWRFLDTSTFWAIGKAKKGLKFWERQKMIFDFRRNDETKGYVADVHARYGGEVNDFRFWVGSNAPTS